MVPDLHHYNGPWRPRLPPLGRQRRNAAEPRPRAAGLPFRRLRPRSRRRGPVRLHRRARRAPGVRGTLRGRPRHARPAHPAHRGRRPVRRSRRARTARRLAAHLRRAHGRCRCRAPARPAAAAARSAAPRARRRCDPVEPRRHARQHRPRRHARAPARRGRLRRPCADCGLALRGIGQAGAHAVVQLPPQVAREAADRRPTPAVAAWRHPARLVAGRIHDRAAERPQRARPARRMEPAQAALLDRVCRSSLFDTATLKAAGASGGAPEIRRPAHRNSPRDGTLRLEGFD